MNWEVIGATGEWAGALAVIVTLMYVARQIRQSNYLAKAEANRDFYHTWHEIVRELGADTLTASIIQRGISNFSALDPSEKGVFNTRIAAIFNEAELARKLCSIGLLDQDVYDSVLNVCVSIVITKGGQEWWQNMESGLPIAEHVETLREQLGSDAIPFDSWEAWKVDA